MDLEEVLRRYRPSGPPRELRDRCVVADGQGSVREWLLPAAAAVAALVFYLLGSGVQREVLRVEGSDEGREAAVTAMTNELGGDSLARIQAERVMKVMEKQPRANRSLLALLPGEEMTP